MDRVPSVDVQNQTIVIGGEGIDAIGRLWVSPSHSCEQWESVISTADLHLMQQRKTLAAQMKEEEKSVAQQMGVGLIYTSDDLRSHPSYSEFLKV